MSATPTRRDVLLGSAAALAASAAVATAAAPRPGFGLCLNTSTVRSADGKSRPIVESIAIASQAGFRALEPWVSEVEEYVKAGGTLADLGKRLADAGLVVPNAIGFAEWIVGDPGRRKKGLEQAKRDFDLVRRIGCGRLAAPPVGATGGTSKRDDGKPAEPPVDLLAAADRYRELFELGRALGVTPLVEVWGFSRTFKRLGETLLVAAESGVEGAAVLPDIYHLYKGGSDFAGLKLLAPTAIGIFHVNDYPQIDRDAIGDADRVYPGDGVAPLASVLKNLHASGYAGYLSVELFNRGYWNQDPHVVAKTAREKLQAVIVKALA